MENNSLNNGHIIEVTPDMFERAANDFSEGNENLKIGQNQVIITSTEKIMLENKQINYYNINNGKINNMGG